MEVSVTLLFVLYFLFEVDCYIIWDNSVEVDFNHIDPTGKSEVRMPNWFFIFPGTKWCGPGNVADNDDDYGMHKDTDKCCQAHDYCPDLIEAHESKYNLTNPAFYTRLACDCDMKFYRCLKDVDSIPSHQVGQIYFSALGTKCYRKDYPVTGCKTYAYFPRKKCRNYIFNESGEKIYQWFDVPNF